MNSLLSKEGMAGQVQMVYIDPLYGIKYGSNFQPFVNKRDVKDNTLITVKIADDRGIENLKVIAVPCQYKFGERIWQR
jgi:16S rRNA G966 N2-methylase RsmD